LSTTASNDERLSFAGRVVIFSEFRPNAAWLAERFNYSGVQCRIARHIDEAEAEVINADLLILDANVGVDAVKRLQTRAPNNCQLIWLSCVGQKAPEGVVVLHKPVTLSALQQALMHVRSVVNTPFKRETVVASAHHHDNQNSKTFSNRKPILIVEDNQVNRIALLHMLKSLGYDADAASSGLEALTLLQQQHYELVLMDIQMADMDGLETTRRINELMGSTAPKIIAVSAHVFPEDIRLTRDAGMIDFVSKPIRRDDLQRILKQYLL
jgi:CheY-like chemotaxis protein